MPFPPDFSPLTTRQVAQDIRRRKYPKGGRVWQVGRCSQSGAVPKSRPAPYPNSYAAALDVEK